MDAQEIVMAGAAKGDITPQKGMLPLPLIAIIHFNRITDPVSVRALALSDGRQKSLFIVMEQMLLPFPKETLGYLSKNTGVPEENILLTVTHTHCVPALSYGERKLHKRNRKCKKYYEYIKEKTLQTAKQALSNMVPARYGYGEGMSYVNVNRDVVRDGKTVIGSNFERPSDKTLRMVRFENMEGALIALIVNYACHAVVMNGCLSGLTCGITGDLPGRTCIKLERQLEDGVVIWCPGAAGDQNPRIMTQYGGPIEKGKPVRKNLGKAAYTILEYLSDEHARDVLDANQALQCTQTAGAIYCSGQIMPVENKDGSGEKVPYVLRLWMIGNIAFQGISAEIATSIGKAVRESSPFDQTILVSHACGYDGYLADEWEFEHNAFEVGNCFAPKGVAQEAFLEGFRKLYSKKQQEVSNGDTTL